MKKAVILFLIGALVFNVSSFLFLKPAYATSPTTHLNEPPVFNTGYYFVNKGETLISANLATDDDNVVLEFGNVTLSGNTPQLISHSQICNPIVVATIRGKNDAEVQRSPRVWNKTSTWFTIKVDNYNWNPPATTYVAYLVVESWSYNIGPMHIQAGSKYTEFVYSKYAQISNWTPVYFFPAFTSNPAVIHTVTSNNDPSWVVSSVNWNDNTRISEPTSSQMSVFLQRSWASNVHSWETIDYLAIDPGHYNINWIEIDAGQSPDKVWGSNDVDYDVPYNSSFPSIPKTFFISQLWEDGGDGGFAQFNSWGTPTVSTFPAIIDEDGPGADRRHTDEIVGFLVFSTSSGTLTTPNTLTYTLSWWADVDKFQLSITGVLSFLTGQDGDNPTDANGDAIYEVGIQVCDSHCDQKCSFEIIRVEVDKKPVLTLNGSGTINIIQGQSFVDPWATCYDEHDGACSVVTSGSVDTSTTGSYTIWYTATDSNWNAADPIFRVVNVLPPAAIILWSVEAIPNETWATIHWETTQKATSQVSYGLTSRLGMLTPEIDISSKVTWHSVNLTGLLACTRYFFEIISRDDGGNEARAWVYSFITRGCPGDSPVSKDTVSNVVYTWSWAMWSGGLSLWSWNNLVVIEVPVGYFDVGTGSCGWTWTFFQLKQLQKELVVDSLGYPSKPKVVRTYEFSAYCKEDEKVHLFDKPLKVSIYYGDDEIAWLEEEDLEIFRYDSGFSKWISLDNCQVDVLANIVSCETDHFSSFALSTIASYTPTEEGYGGQYKPIDYCIWGDKSGDLYDGKCEAPSEEDSSTSTTTWDVEQTWSQQDEQISQQYLQDLKQQYLEIIEQIKLLNKLKNQWWEPKLWFTLPAILPQTWTPIEQRTYRRRVPSVEVDLPPAEVFRLKWTYKDDINYRTQVLPEIDRGKDEYIVVPSNWLVMPIVRVPQWTTDYQDMVAGKQIDINKYLRNWAMYYPTTDKYLGKAGNAVIFGHSSYYKSDPWRYKTQFQKIIELDPWEEVWIYRKNWSGEYQRYVYQVQSSYETTPTDVEILKPTKDSTLTLFTCTPIGGIAHRWIVRAKLDSQQDLGQKIYELESKLYGYNVLYKYKILINKVIKQKIEPLSPQQKETKIPQIIKKIDKFLSNPKYNSNKTLKATLEYLRMKLLLSLFG